MFSATIKETISIKQDVTIDLRELQNARNEYDKTKPHQSNVSVTIIDLAGNYYSVNMLRLGYFIKLFEQAADKSDLLDTIFRKVQEQNESAPDISDLI